MEACDQLGRTEPFVSERRRQPNIEEDDVCTVQGQCLHERWNIPDGDRHLDTREGEGPHDSFARQQLVLQHRYPHGMRTTTPVGEASRLPPVAATRS